MSRKKILIVDDEPGLIDIVRVNLEWEGYRVLEAASGPEGLERAIEEQPDLVILDLMMPQMSGWDVLEEMQANPQTAGLPVIMLTVVADDESMAHGLEKGVVAYVTKPFVPADLIKVVKRVLGESG